MKNTILIIAVFIISQTAYSQVIIPGGENDTFNIEQKKEVKKYYKYIHKAEDMIMKGDYKKASCLYLKAFKYKFPFRDDIRNAENAELKAGKDSARMTQLIIYRVKAYGGKFSNSELYERFSHSSKYNSLPYFKSWENIFDTILISIKYNPKLDKRLKEISKEINSIMDSYPYHKTKEQSRKMKEAHYPLLDEVMELYKKHSSICETNLNSFEGIFKLIDHTPERMTTWYPIIKKEILNGNFKNGVFEDFSLRAEEELGNKIDIFGYKSGIILFDKYIVIDKSKKKLKQINKRRELIMLEPYYKAHNKRIWQWKNELNSETKFHFGPQYALINFFELEFASDEEKEKMNEKQEIIIKKMRSEGLKFKVYNLKIN